MNIQFKYPVLFVSILITILIYCGSPVKAQLLLIDTQERTEVAGKITAVNLDVNRFEVGDVPKHYVALINCSGVNENQGTHVFMDGATVSNLIMSDNTNGSGPFNGYLKFSLNGESVCLEGSGYMRTKPGDNKILCFTGSFHFRNGTGIYENIYGVGVFEGEFVTQDQYVIVWKGKYTLNKDYVF